MKNSDPNTIYRNCVDKIKGNCPYMYLNEFNVECCSIDRIVQVKYFGCTPQHVLAKYNQSLEPTSKDSDGSV